MIKKNLKVLIITSIVVLLPILAGVSLWEKLPDKLPLHWNANGEVDSWGSKPFVVFAVPAIMLAIHWVCSLVTLADPKKQNHSPKMIQFVFWMAPAISALISAITYFSAIGSEIQVEMIVFASLGAIFTVIGNYLPKCGQNYTIGIKIPWTLSSEENWNKTHRLAGWIWVFGGIATIALSFIGIYEIIIAIALVMALAPVVYSYILHKKGI